MSPINSYSITMSMSTDMRRHLIRHETARWHSATLPPAQPALSHFQFVYRCVIIVDENDELVTAVSLPLRQFPYNPTSPVWPTRRPVPCDMHASQ